MRTMKLLVLLAVFCGLALAAQDFKKAPPKKELTIQTLGKHGYLIKAKPQPNSGSVSRLEFQYSNNPYPHFRQRYFSKDDDSALTYTFRIGILGVVEFVDTGNLGLRGNDSIVRRWPFIPKKSNGPSKQFNDIQTREYTSNNTKTIEAWSTLTNDEGTKLIISSAISADVFRDKLNRQLLPNALKFDINITDVVYHQTSPKTKIALVVSINAKSAYKVNMNNDVSDPIDASNQEGEVVVGEQKEGRFVWVKNVVGRFLNKTESNYPIVATLLTGKLASDFGMGLDRSDNDFEKDDDFDGNEAEVLVGLTFDTETQPKHYYWDPATQVNDGSSSSTSSANKQCGASFLVASFIFFVSFFFKFSQH